MAEKYTIEIHDLETVAYLEALVFGSNPRDINLRMTLEERVENRFPGGVSAARALATLGGTAPGRRGVFDQLEEILRENHVTRDCAPWLKPKALTEIDGNRVTCRRDGVTVGCAEVTLEELKLLVEKCEAS